MADKYSEGDEIRLTRNIQFGNVTIRKTTKGEIRKISGGMMGKKYEVMWHSPRVIMTMNGSKDFVPFNN